MSGRCRLALLVLIMAAAGMIATPAQAQIGTGLFADDSVAEIRSLPTAELGIARPEGLAFSWGDDSLLVADARRRQTRVVRLSLLEKRRGSIRLPRLRRPETLSFDTARRRLAAVGP